MKRCLNNCFCYCLGQPDASIKEVEWAYRDEGGRYVSQRGKITVCQKTTETCPDRITQTKLQASIPH